MSTYITLKKGEKVFIDSEDYDFLTNFSEYWRISGRYVICVKNKKVIRMHRLLMNPKEGELVDHINNNPLDNRKENLRVVDNSGNTRNSRKTSRKTSSKYKGVSFDKRTKLWKVSISSKETGRIHIGYYSNEDAGALAYNHHATILFGEYAWLNEVDGSDIDFNEYLVRGKKS